jgi:hypothetical protein
VIAILTIIMFFQKCGGDKYVPPAPTVDTVIQYVQIHDTVKGKIKYIKSKPDTLWMDSLVYRPDTSYYKLLDQYKALGNKHFSTNIFKSEFNLGEYGKATVTDTVNHNQLIASGLSYNISVPEKTITIEKQAPAKRQIYIGAGAYGSRQNIIDGVYVGGLYKDRKDRITGASIGYGNNQLQFGVSSYFKIKF